MPLISNLSSQNIRTFWICNPIFLADFVTTNLGGSFLGAHQSHQPGRQASPKSAWRSFHKSFTSNGISEGFQALRKAWNSFNNSTGSWEETHQPIFEDTQIPTVEGSEIRPTS